MSIELSDQLARTIEIQTAIIYLRGESAGVIEVPIYVGRPDRAQREMEQLLLRVDGEDQLLHSIRREYFCGRLRLMYFSKAIQKTRRLPRALQLCWNPSDENDQSNGMELAFTTAGGESHR
ncbi:MAG: hypothetical protein KDA84_19840 [Planctomycetaceae bacterium]|nr:hypothetical protein [Planctomycetaceae bacterium]